MDCLGGILSDNLKDLVCLAVNQLRYPCCFNNFVKELEKEERNLIATRRDVKDRVDHANKQTKKTAEVIHKWLEDADIGEADVKNLLIKAKSKKSCCFGHCPNWILRYHFGRKLVNKKKELEELIKKGEPFVQLERVATLPSETLYFPSDKYLKFESRESAFKQVMEAVKDEEVNMIGLYGMGGCGKTTLAEEVKKIAEAEHRFDKVLFVAVSSTVEVRGIQKKIASSLQYTFPQVNEEKERATALCERLAEEKKILVILDDVWQRLDFGAIGIPLTEHHKGCKVLITTRSEDVCTLMDCQKRIQLHILTDEEAWTLFQKQADLSEDTSDTIKHLAREISDECKGLPVAIAAVAGSLKGKDKEIWKVALNRLRKSKPVDIEKGLRDPYKCLQLSYDNLDTEEAKSLFLFCSVFPEDYEIPTDMLTKLAIGLGVVGEVRSYDEAKSEVIAAKIKLVSSCLLMLDADDDDECVKMHDLVRDVAHLIAKDENKVIKCQLDNDVTLEQSSIRYLWCEEFPNDLDCSNLEFLHIDTKLEVLDEIFKRMEKLRVLFLINRGEDDMQPLSTILFKTLTNLRCLFLVRWELSDISFVRDTKKLQSLSLYRCSLPSFLDIQTGEFYKQLTKLKLLELVDCKMEKNNYNVIGRIPQLEELRIFDNKEWHDWNEETIELFKTFGVPQGLQCYAIVLGNFDDDYADEFLLYGERILLLSCFHISNEAIKDLAKRAKVLQMGNIKGGAKNIIPHVFEMKEGSLNKLNELGICDSEEIECLVDMNNNSSEVGTFFSELLELRILKMNNLRVLWDGCLLLRETFLKLEELHLQKCPKLTSLFTHSAGSFTLPNLTELKVEECPKLSSLFSIFTAKSLISLQKLSISDCDDLKHIITPESGHKNEKKGMVVDGHDLKNVISMFPSLKSVYISGCENLEINFPLSWLPPEIKDFVGTTNSNDLNEKKTLFSQLLHLRIYYRKHLKVLLDDYLPRGTFQKLETLHLKECSELTYLFTCSPGSFTLSNLTEVWVESCQKLRTLFTISTAQTLTSLKKLVIRDCDDLKHIVTPERGHKNEREDIIVEHDYNLQSVISMFPNLEEVDIYGCAKLEVIFPLSYLPEDKNLSNLVSLQPRFPKLSKLVVEHCHKLKRVFSTSASIGLSNLEILIINGAAEIEELFGSKHGKGHEIQKAKVELPKLKLMIFMNLPNLCQGNELLAVKHRFVHNCPKLALTSTTTLRELKENISRSDFENVQLSWWELLKLIDKVLSSRDTSELPLLQISEESEKDFIEEVKGSEVQATTTSTNLELNGRLSLNPLDICQRETNIELVDQESSSKAGFSDQHEPEDTINIEDIGKESIQEVSLSKGLINKTLSTGVEGIGLGGGVATHTKSSGGGIIAQGSQVVEIDVKLDESKTVTRTRLEAYKRFVDLDDTQIALLVETIAAYPHLWNSCQKFGERFQAWMLKTLADMLLFLRNESASGVTPQKEKEFHKLCDEAIELGFDSSWVDEMRQHIVVARDPKLEEDRAQSQINELFKRSTDADMVEQGDGPNEHCIGTSQCQKIQNVDHSIKEESNLLIDKKNRRNLSW